MQVRPNSKFLTYGPTDVLLPYLSTNSSADLSRYNSELLKFQPPGRGGKCRSDYFEASTEMVRRVEIGVQLRLSPFAVSGVGLWQAGCLVSRRR